MQQAIAAVERGSAPALRRVLRSNRRLVDQRIEALGGATLLYGACQLGHVSLARVLVLDRRKVARGREALPNRRRVARDGAAATGRIVEASALTYQCSE